MTPLTRSLLRAASEGDSSLIKSLLAQGADVDSSNAAGQTALMLGAAFGHESVVQFLLTVGARLDPQDELGLSALDWAKNSPSISKLITEAGNAKADPTGDLVSPPPVNVTETQPLDEPPLVRSTLPGLAGAIWRDKKKAPLQEAPFEEVPATTEPLPAVTVPDFSTLAVTAPIDIRGTEPPTLEKRYETTPEIIPEPDSTVDSDQNDDTTLPRNQRIAIEESSASPVRTASSNRIFDIAESQVPQPPLSKVQVAVPEHGKSRPLVWVLVLLFFFLGVGAFVGYRLLHYLLQKPEPAVVQAPASEVVQPPAIPVKSGPVVGGDLVGTELHLTEPEASDINKTGKVTVNVRVSQKGIVMSADAVSGEANLQRAAEKAAKASAFSPDKLAGKGAFISGTITYTFSPTGSGGPTTSGESSTPVAGGPLAGAEVNLVEPRYRSSASKAVVSKVTIVVRVNRSGRVVSWRPLGGDSRFKSAAISAARQSTFSPQKLPSSGDVVGTITYTFH